VCLPPKKSAIQKVGPPINRPSEKPRRKKKEEKRGEGRRGRKEEAEKGRREERRKRKDVTFRRGFFRKVNFGPVLLPRES
jgi:hypothetical protein